jgi:hypothetical protein
MSPKHPATLNLQTAANNVEVDRGDLNPRPLECKRAETKLISTFSFHTQYF